MRWLDLVIPQPINISSTILYDENIQKFNIKLKADREEREALLYNQSNYNKETTCK